MRSCYSEDNKRRSQDKMWSFYYKMRVSESYKDEWAKFLMESVGHTSTPAFYQNITDVLFQQLVKADFSILPNAAAENLNEMTLEEQNALRYVAGYVCRKVREHLETSHYDKKDDMIIAITTELAGDEMNEMGTEAWTNMIDRGGLWHVNDETYELFVNFEDEVKQLMSIPRMTVEECDKKEKLINDICCSSTVQFQWSLLMCDVETDIASTVLKEIVKLYVTIRGFAFASSCLEFYKQAQKESLQKKKALRKEITSKD